MHLEEWVCDDLLKADLDGGVRNEASGNPAVVAVAVVGPGELEEEEEERSAC